MPSGVTFEQTLALLRGETGVLALDSAGGQPNRFSLIAFEPREDLSGLSSLEDLRGALGTWSVEGEVPGPFAGGFLGALSYDLGVTGEPLDLPDEPWGLPKIIGGLYTDFFLFDHESESAHLILDDRADLEKVQAEWLRRLKQNPTPPRPYGVGEPTRHTPSPVHEKRIEQARQAIARGDYYQVNLAHRFTAPMQGDPLDLYLRLRLANPAPYGAYLRTTEFACLSTSPELLMQFDGSEVVTRPIKGTAPRHENPAQDKEARGALLQSEKDRAELAMIVDLERNDLGRFATPGSVSVDRFPDLETYARVHHLVATVRAKPKPGIDAIGMLQALFPGGSITGAPKLASMQAISELEGEGRGLFTGSLGFVDLRGRALFNILIRTVLWRPIDADRSEISYRVGGGITYASNAQDEDQETLHKAQGMTDAWS